jgi:hypothetical protein
MLHTAKSRSFILFKKCILISNLFPYFILIRVFHWPQPRTTADLVAPVLTIIQVNTFSSNALRNS